MPENAGHSVPVKSHHLVGRGICFEAILLPFLLLEVFSSVEVKSKKKIAAVLRDTVWLCSATARHRDGGVVPNGVNTRLLVSSRSRAAMLAPRAF